LSSSSLAFLAASSAAVSLSTFPMSVELMVDDSEDCYFSSLLELVSLLKDELLSGSWLLCDPLSYVELDPSSS
jgi:hypothetical protein